jgi:Tol biopolymer transport system component
MTSFAMTRRTFLPGSVGSILIVAALLFAALLTVVLLQAGRPNVPPFGEARNGRIVFVDGIAVRSAAADGTDVRTIATLPAAPSLPVISPDGRLVAVSVEGAGIDILPVAGDARRVQTVLTAPGMTGYGPAAWSPDGDLVAFIAGDTRSDHLFVARPDGSNLKEVGADMVEPGHVIGWASFSPDGRWLAFLEAPEEAPGRLVVVAPDGSGARSLETNLVEKDNGANVAWSPDPAKQRLLYLAYGGPTYYYDLQTSEDVYVAIGFWPSWSPTGDRISYWHNGTKVIDTPASSAGARTPIAIFPEFTEGCGDRADLAGTALCGPVTWSPDGTRVIATEVTGDGLLSLRSDGSGDPRFVDLTANLHLGEGGIVAWQPVTP